MSIHKNDNFNVIKMVFVFLLYQIMFQMQNNALFLKEKYMVSNQPDEVNKGD